MHELHVIQMKKLTIISECVWLLSLCKLWKKCEMQFAVVLSK